MLDYTLVSAKATYRMPTPRDVPGLVQLVQAFYREDAAAIPMPAEKVMATVAALGQSRDRGSLFVFECEGMLAGYAILVLYWSNELGGTVIVIDELYVEPGHRNRGIATDFIGLLTKVAPPEVVGLQLEVTPSRRRGLGLYRRLGFTETGRRILSLPIHRR
jgi:ribosomal protein S18 acetylase RimI-like enzyme